MSYSIKEVSEMMNVETSTLRYWDQEGLLPNIKRVNGIRVFEDKDFKWLRVLNCMKRLNMSIKKIKEYVDLAQLGDSTLQERYDLILEQKEVIIKKLEELNFCLKEFEFKEWYYKTAIVEGTEDNVSKFVSEMPSLEFDKIPRNYKKENENE